jgi:KaiC/GvpD/RAD55 family RecA-like ATPase
MSAELAGNAIVKPVLATFQLLSEGYKVTPSSRRSDEDIIGGIIESVRDRGKEGTRRHNELLSMRSECVDERVHVLAFLREGTPMSLSFVPL